jgi:hypothetical protein
MIPEEPKLQSQPLPPVNERILEYQSPSAKATISFWQALGGMIVSFFLIAVAICAGLGALKVFGVFGLVVMIGIPAFGMIFWAVSEQRVERSRGFAIGLWLGIGLIVLICGAGIVALSRI